MAQFSSLLGQWHLIEERGDGRLSPAPLESALEMLDAIWDNLFDFKVLALDLMGVIEETVVTIACEPVQYSKSHSSFIQLLGMTARGRAQGNNLALG